MRVADDTFYSISECEWIKIDRQHLFLFIFYSFISNIFGIFLRGNLLIKCPQMFTGPVGPAEVLFYWPKAIFGNFYWPGALGPLLASSPDDFKEYLKAATINCSLSLTTAYVQNQVRACEKVTSDLVKSGGFRQVLQFPPPLTTNES